MLMTQKFHSRRAALRARLIAQGGGVAILATAPERTRNADTHYSYRPDSSFHYLTGFAEPEAVMVLTCDPASDTLFCREKNVEREIWDGFRYGPEGAVREFGFAAAFDVCELDARLPDLIANQPVLWVCLGQDAAWDSRIVGALNAVRAQTRAGKRAPPVLRDLRSEIDDMRLIKSADEIALMRRAGEISAAAHVRAMQATQPGLYEYAIEAELLHEFRRHGCDAPAYTSIVAGGANACVLHYISNDQMLVSGDLLLIDAGGEYQGYASDITRTFPVNGRFSGAQRAVYELVLAAQKAAMGEVKPGCVFEAYHDAAVRVLVEGLIDLKLLTGSIDGALESGSYKRFYMHRTGHWLGRDVHDCGEYKVHEQSRPLQPGMVLTVEPGLYIRAADDVPSEFWDIGVRIEDDLLVTDSGHDNLTVGAPTAVEAIEALMQGRA
jgi:Xaa-Pro aminopeptidase